MLEESAAVGAEGDAAADLGAWIVIRKNAGCLKHANPVRQVSPIGWGELANPGKPTFASQAKRQHAAQIPMSLDLRATEAVWPERGNPPFTMEWLSAQRPERLPLEVKLGADFSDITATEHMTANSHPRRASAKTAHRVSLNGGTRPGHVPRPTRGRRIARPGISSPASTEPGWSRFLPPRKYCAPGWSHGRSLPSCTVPAAMRPSEMAHRSAPPALARFHLC